MNFNGLILFYCKIDSLFFYQYFITNTYKNMADLERPPHGVNC